MVKERSLEERMQVLEDKAAITELCYKYCYYVDAQEWDRWLEECFTEDAVLQRPPYVLQGKEEIRRHQGRTQYTMMCHLSLNVTAEIHGDTATGKSYFFFLGTCPVNGELQELIGAGSNTDTYRKENGTWKISSRTISFKVFNSLKEGWANQPLINTLKR